MTQAQSTTTTSASPRLASVLSSGTLGVDKTGGHISHSSATQLAALGYRFALRNIGLPNLANSQNGQLTKSEVEDLHSAGLVVGIFQLSYLQTSITSQQGQLDATYLIEQAQALGAPMGLTLWFDLEGSFQQASSNALADYVNAWAATMTAAGFVAGLYTGIGSSLSGSTISNLPNVHAYWQAGQRLDYAMPARGYQMYQLNPPSQLIGETHVDLDVVQDDFKGDAASFF